MTICEQTGRWAAGLSLEAIPSRVLDRARLQSEAMLAAADAGADAAKPFAAAAPEGPLGDVYRSAVASIAHDWDDYLFMGHTGHSAVWAARAFVDSDDRSLLAQVAANEVAGRLGAALFLGPHNGQFWSSIHCAGGAVATAVGLGLDAERTAHALAIALYQPPFGVWPGFMGPDSKLLTAADPATQGARAALLAAEGVEGALDVIENRRGVLTNFSFEPLEGMLGALGDVWLTDTLAFKPRPGCAYLQAPLDAALAAELDPGDIDSIDVEAGLLTCSMEELGRGDDLSPVRVTFSAALSIAVALIAGRLTHVELDPAWLGRHRTEVVDLAAKVSVRHDPDLTLATMAGTVDAGVGLGSVGLAGWRRVRRRTRELGMVDLGWGELAGLLRSRSRSRRVASLLRRSRSQPAALGAIDTSKVKLTFPARLRVRLRSGDVREIEGSEPGGCGSTLDEQRAVVEEKRRIASAPVPA